MVDFLEEDLLENGKINYIMNNYNYYTQDGHLMIEGEIMWRICNSEGKLFSKPTITYFSQNTGYNHLYISNEEQYNCPHLNPYEANHLHYYDFNIALEELNKRK